MATTATTNGAYEFLVRRDDLHQSAFFETPDPAAVALVSGQALLAVEAFAFTANNITYAVFGDAMRYWNFFPARTGWGVVPVWGFATVARSAHPALAQGERLYGYLPMSTHTVVAADDVTAGAFREVSPHRSDLPAIYNQYLLTKGDRGYDPAREAEQMLFRPLFLTAYLIDDFLRDASFFGARAVVLSSASSKTAIGVAFCLSALGRKQCDVIGLTSRAHAPFVERLGCYDRVVAYEDVASLPATVPTVFVDMAGDATVTSAVHRHFGDGLEYSCSVGGTHWERLAFGQEFPGPPPTLFFAPSQAAKRIAEWGAGELQTRMGDAWASFLPRVDGWLGIERTGGRDAIERVYRETLEGRADPSRGYVLSF